MKRGWITVILISMALFCACGKQPVPEDPPVATEVTEATSLPVPENDTTMDDSQSSDGTLLWETGNRILLLQEHGFSLYLAKDSDFGNIVYDIQTKNDSTVPMRLLVTDICYNDRILGSGNQILYSSPGEWDGTISGLSIPLAVVANELDRVQRISFHVQVTDTSTGNLLLERDLQVDTKGHTSLRLFHRHAEDYLVQGPMLGFHAPEEQLLTEKDGVKVSILTIGTNNTNELLYLYKVENTSEEVRHFIHMGTAVNNVFYSDDTSRTKLLPGAVYCDAVTIGDFYGMEQIGSVALYLDISAEETSTPAPSWYSVVPQSIVDDPTPLTEGEQLLLDEQGLRISLKSENRDSFGNLSWTLVVVNTTERDLRLGLWDVAVGDQQGTGYNQMGIHIYPSHTASQMRTVTTVDAGKNNVPVSFLLWVTDSFTGETLFTTQSRIELVPS